VRPQNVFLSEKGKIKIGNVFSWPDELSNQSKALEGQVTYLAP